MTLWARHFLDSGELPSPLEPDEFKQFFRALWPETEKPKKIRESMKTSFFSWLCEHTGMEAHEISRDLGQILRDLFDEIESEYGSVAEADLDPRYIRMFIIRHGPAVME